MKGRVVARGKESTARRRVPWVMSPDDCGASALGVNDGRPVLLAAGTNSRGQGWLQSRRVVRANPRVSDGG
jgi:hypothetical protein